MWSYHERLRCFKVRILESILQLIESLNVFEFFQLLIKETQLNTTQSNKENVLPHITLKSSVGASRGSYIVIKSGMMARARATF